MRRSADGPATVTPSLRDTLLLRERALQATTVSVVITDTRLPDNPIVWTNEEFTRTTGYASAEVLGRNPRFLQGPDSDASAVAEMRDSIKERRPSMVTLINYRADGSTFWNSVSTAPVFDDDGEAIGFIGIQVDVTERVLAQREHDEQLREEHTARLVAEKAQRTLSLLADINECLVSTFDLRKAMQALVNVLVPRFADACAVDLVGEASAGSDRPERVAEASIRTGPGGSADEVGDPALLGRVLRTSRPVSVQDLADPEAESMLVVPLKAHGGVVGAMTLVSIGHARSYDEEHLEMSLDIGRRAAQSIEWCRLYERERRVAAMLQRSLLPELPRIPGLEVAALYRPGPVRHQVGGDWYDLLPLPSGSVGIVIGDVMGHDMDAAAAMGRMRSVLRSYAYECGSPSAVLDRLDQLARGLEAPPSTSAWYGVLDPDGTLTHASAGHLPPLLQQPDGHTTFLSSGGRDAGQGMKLGGAGASPRRETTDVVEPGATLVLYTDGLVATSDAEAGLDELRAFVSAMDVETDPQARCTQILERPEISGVSTERDDVAILILKKLPTSTSLTAGES